MLLRVMMRYGLLGKSLPHSRSPAIHALFGNDGYKLLEVDEAGFEQFVRAKQFAGVNVTIPYKRKALTLCEPDDAAKAIGSVNTLVVRGGHVLGYNTDCAGFCYMLSRAGIELAGKKVVILGSGGTGHTAVYAAKQKGASQIVVVSRNGENNYENLLRHSDAQVLINTTPVGMFPRGEDCPVSLDLFDRLEGVADVIYNPLRTRLVLEAQDRGIPSTGGLPMLLAQGYIAHRLFFDLHGEIPQFELDELYSKFLGQTRNIVLVGMPGCGKTTVGRALAERLGLTFLDTDLLICQACGKPAGTLILKQGEPTFRKLESEIVSDISTRAGCVIATGGGSVLSEANRMALRQNAMMIFLDRPTEELDTQGRPLSMDLSEMEKVRRPIYEGIADAIIPPGSVDEQVERIIEVWS